MSKKKKIAKEPQNKAGSVKTILRSQNWITRREALGTLITASTGCLGWGSYKLYDYATRWDFLENVPNSVDERYHKAMRTIPIHLPIIDPRRPMRKIDFVNAYSQQEISDLIKQSAPPGIDPNKHPPRISGFIEMRGVPEEYWEGKHAVEHAIKVYDFIVQQYPGLGLEQRVSKFSKLRSTFDTTYKNRVASVVVGNCLIKTTYTELDFGGIKTLYTRHFTGMDSMTLFFDGGGQFIYLSSGSPTTILISPFSEYAGAIVGDSYSKDSSNALSKQQAVEAATEAMSRVMCEQFIARFNVPNGMTLLKTTTKHLDSSDIYRYVRTATAFTRKNGVTATYDAYMQDPAAFLRMVKDP